MFSNKKRQNFGPFFPRLHQSISHTSIHLDDIGLSGQSEFCRRGFPLVEILIKPVFPVFKRLCAYDVHEPCQEFHVFQQEMKMSKDELRVPVAVTTTNHHCSMCSEALYIALHTQLVVWPSGLRRWF